MGEVFEVELPTKLHRLMRHIHHHLFHLGCIRRDSSKETYMAHIQFKMLYNARSKHLNAIDPQLLTFCIDLPLLQSHSSLNFSSIPHHTVAHLTAPPVNEDRHDPITNPSFPSITVWYSVYRHTHPHSSASFPFDFTTAASLLQQTSGTVGHTSLFNTIQNLQHNDFNMWLLHNKIDISNNFPMYDLIFCRTFFAGD